VADYRLIRLSAALLLVGLVLTIVAQVPHPVGNTLANVDAFTAYAATSVEFYAAIHLAQFTGEGILMLGLLVPFFALNLSAGMARMVGNLGAVSAGAALALTGVVTAVDAVALKQAVDAWASAPAAEKAHPNRWETTIGSSAWCSLSRQRNRGAATPGTAQPMAQYHGEEIVYLGRLLREVEDHLGESVIDGLRNHVLLSRDDRRPRPISSGPTRQGQHYQQTASGSQVAE
jgi:hypothetical protein